MKGFIQKIFPWTMLLSIVSAIQTCHFNVFQSGFANDAMSIINMIRNPTENQDLNTYNNGMCGRYKRILYVNGTQNSSLEIFENSIYNVAIGIFNVKNDDKLLNTDIIQMKPPTFLKTHFRKQDQGFVVEEFQNIFESIVVKIPKNFYSDTFRKKQLILASYGVGGALNIFYATYLHHLKDFTVSSVFNFGSPFISTREFDDNFVLPIRNKIGAENWINMEVVNIINAEQRDTISESFNRNTSPFIYIPWSTLCVAYILPYWDLDIHNEMNYKIPLIGFNCVV